MIEVEDLSEPGAEADAWADYQAAAARKDLVEALTELRAGNFGMARALLGRAWRCVRLVVHNREKAAADRVRGTGRES